MHGFFERRLEQDDSIVSAAIRLELTRQQDQIELIASENIVSPAVLAAQGTVLTNKYAEGYPGHRYYGGCEHVDTVESVAIERANQLFDSKFANVQPHSGAQANGAVLLALLQPGDTILGMSLEAGGHLTHGARPTLSGKWFNAAQYGVRKEDCLIDFDAVESIAREKKPKLIIAGGSAYPRFIDFARLRKIADAVEAYRHGAYRGTGRRRRTPQPATSRACRDIDDPQDPSWASRRAHSDERRGVGKEVQLGGVSGTSRRPAHACHSRKGRRFRRSTSSGVQDLCGGGRGQFKKVGCYAFGAGLCHRVRRN